MGSSTQSTVYSPTPALRLTPASFCLTPTYLISLDSPAVSQMQQVGLWLHTLGRGDSEIGRISSHICRRGLETLASSPAPTCDLPALLWTNGSCCCSVTKSCLSICNPMDCSMPCSSVFHYILEFVQTHVRLVGDTIQPSFPPLPPSPHAFNLSQHQGVFQ